MRIKLFIIAVGALLIGGCSSAHDGTEPRVSEKTLNAIDPPGTAKPEPAEKEKVAEGFLPGSDKIYFVGDRKVVRAETNSRPVLVPESTRRLLVGNAEDGDISLQPALLQRELAEELARSRQLNEQNRALMVQMVAASANLVAAMEQLKKLNAELAQKLEQQVAYAKALEEKKTADPKASSTAKAGEAGQQF